MTCRGGEAELLDVVELRTFFAILLSFIALELVAQVEAA